MGTKRLPTDQDYLKVLDEGDENDNFSDISSYEEDQLQIDEVLEQEADNDIFADNPPLENWAAIVEANEARMDALFNPSMDLTHEAEEVEEKKDEKMEEEDKMEEKKEDEGKKDEEMEEEAKMKEEEAKMKEEKTKIEEEAKRMKEEKAKIEKEAKKMKEEKAKIEKEAKRMKEEKAKIEKEAKRVNEEMVKIEQEAKRMKEEKAKMEEDKVKVGMDEAPSGGNGEKETEIQKIVAAVLLALQASSSSTASSSSSLSNVPGTSSTMAMDDFGLIGPGLTGTTGAATPTTALGQSLETLAIQPVPPVMLVFNQPPPPFQIPGQFNKPPPQFPAATPPPLPSTGPRTPPPKEDGMEMMEEGNQEAPLHNQQPLNLENVPGEEAPPPNQENQPQGNGGQEWHQFPRKMVKMPLNG
jgi:chemotaxis protein histidine kinase CheA